MHLHGGTLIGRHVSREGHGMFSAVAAATGATLEPGFAESTSDEIDRAARAAETAFDAVFATHDTRRRSTFLRGIADRIVALSADIVERAHAETALPIARLEGECGRTAAQLRMFADLIDEGSWVDARIDRALPDRTPLPRPDLRRMLVAVGPVAVFGASNFPLAFSVAGGDTASALAAGCSVIVKAHPAHPGTSEIVAGAILEAADAASMPDGIFSMVHGISNDVGLSLVTHPLVKAVAFTGSFQGGRALFDAASRRDEPIPVFAEMGSSNPVFVLPRALEERGEDIARGLAASVTLGAGQFCTNPGLSALVDSSAAERFLEVLGASLAAAPLGTVVTESIKHAFDRDLAGRVATTGVTLAARASGDGASAATSVAPALLIADSETLATNAHLSDELYGPATLAVRCGSRDDLLAFARSLSGHLTATVHGTPDDLAEHAELLRILRRKAGRLVVNGFPTGVEVCSAMHHGGPYPATTDPRATSVGTAAIARFARPVCFQNFADDALPEELRAANPLGILRSVDGVMTR